MNRPCNAFVLLSVAVGAMLVYAYLPFLLMVAVVLLAGLAVQRLIVLWKLTTEVRRHDCMDAGGRTTPGAAVENSEARMKKPMATKKDSPLSHEEHEGKTDASGAVHFGWDEAAEPDYTVLRVPVEFEKIVPLRLSADHRDPYVYLRNRG